MLRSRQLYRSVIAYYQNSSPYILCRSCDTNELVICRNGPTNIIAAHGYGDVFGTHPGQARFKMDGGQVTALDVRCRQKPPLLRDLLNATSVFAAAVGPGMGHDTARGLYVHCLAVLCSFSTGSRSFAAP